MSNQKLWERLQERLNHKIQNFAGVAGVPDDYSGPGLRRG